VSHFNLGFCDDFGYPSQIRDHFVEILDQICLHLGTENLKLVVLFGSTSRGELTYDVTDDNHIELFSDYEFLIVTERGVATSKTAELSQLFADNKVRWGIRNPLFHIEFMHNSAFKLRAKRLLVRNIPSFELSETGIVIYGEDGDWNRYRARITPRNLNLGAVNELIIERLWRQLQFVWDDEPDHDGEVRSDRVAQYFTARNALEILTILLPNQGILLPGYRPRHAYFIEHYQHGQPILPEFAGFMRECLDAKLYLRLSQPFEYYYERMLTGFLALTSWLVDGGISGSPALTELPLVCRRLTTTGVSMFREPVLWRLRRVVREYHVARRLKGSQPIRWALRDKRPYVLALLLYVHSWILAQLAHTSLPDSYLSEARQLLARVNLTTGGDVQDWEGVVYETQGLLASWRKS
jgi:predicted nucleotidyltransferase